jgi:multidrug efflux system outer membrane protein
MRPTPKLRILAPKQIRRQEVHNGSRFGPWDCQFISDFGFRISDLSIFSLAAGVASVLFLAGCKVGPEYHRPAAVGTNTLPATFLGSLTTNTTPWKAAEPSAHLPRGAWWRLFEDPELDRIETLATLHNQDVAAALARFDEARASIGIARADLFPQAQFEPMYTRQRTSVNEPSNGRPAGAAYNFDTFIMQLRVGWEADVWGRIRRQVEAARARLAASAGDVEALKLSLQAELASDYFILRAVDAEYDLLARSAETYRHSLGLTLNRRKGGIASDLDVSQAETQLRSTEAELPPLRLQRSKLLHALATLCGQPATGFDLAATPQLQPSPNVPVALPSELLERRPDLAAAEQRMAAANAEIGVAQSAFYPRLMFNGLGGFQSISASSWFDWPSRFWAVGPSLELPLFTGGRNRAQLEFARASYEETIANYRQTVLLAFQEVEDRLAAQQLLKAMLEAQAAALKAAQRTLEIANNRYKAGLVTYLEVAVAQGSALGIERTVVGLRGQKVVSTVGLIKALGGGWEATPQGLTTQR